MTLTVAPTSGYNSYVSLADATAFHTDRNTAAWLAATDAARTAALIRATDYIEAVYTFRADPFNYGGDPCAQDGDSDDPAITGVIEPPLAKATCVMAVYGLASTLAEERQEQATILTMQKLDGVGETRTESTKARISDHYPMVTAILAPIASTSFGSSVVTRRVR